MIVLVGTSEDRLRIGRQVGATHTVDASKAGSEERLRDIVGPQGADIVLDCAGNTRAFALAESIIGWNGRIVIEGIYDSDDVIAVDGFRLLLMRSVAILGVNGWNTSEFNEALNLIAAGRIDTKAIVTHAFPLADWEEGFRTSRERVDGAIKVLLCPN